MATTEQSINLRKLKKKTIASEFDANCELYSTRIFEDKADVGVCLPSISITIGTGYNVSF